MLAPSVPSCERHLRLLAVAEQTSLVGLGKRRCKHLPSLMPCEASYSTCEPPLNPRIRKPLSPKHLGDLTPAAPLTQGRVGLSGYPRMVAFCGKLRGYISMISSCLCDFCEPKHVHFAWTSKKNVANTLVESPRILVLVESPRHGTMNNCSSTYLYCGTITSFYCGIMISKRFFNEKKIIEKGWKLNMEPLHPRAFGSRAKRRFSGCRTCTAAHLEEAA